MIIDEKGKLFGKISVIDLCAILIVIVGIIGIFATKSKMDGGKIISDSSQMLISTSTKMDKLEIKLKVKGVRSMTRDAFVVGDDVYLTSTYELLGTVTRVESEPAMRNIVGDKGVVYSTIMPDRYDITIYLEADGKKTEEGYFTKTNFQLLYGRELEIVTSTVQTYPVIEDVTVKKTTK